MFLLTGRHSICTWKPEFCAQVFRAVLTQREFSGRSLQSLPRDKFQAGRNFLKDRFIV